MNPTMLIFGFGYTAQFLVKPLCSLGFRVEGTSRHLQSRPGVFLIPFERESIEKQLSQATHVLISTPPSQEQGDPVLALCKDLLTHYAANIKWMGYLSSTSVYGDHQGAWVDEVSASFNLGLQGQCRLNAEQAWRDFAKAQALPLHIFRLAGIYGPGSNALDRIRAGKSETTYKPNHVFSRIHVEDIVSVLMASILKPNPGSIYNVADDEPAPAYEVEEYASMLLAKPPLKRIPFELAQLSPMAKEFYAHHRRVSNHKIKSELSVTLAYPSYREGLRALNHQGEKSC